MSGRTRRRPWLAALLALVVSGLGHAYLRRWARALGWYVAVVAAVFVFVPDATVTAVFAGDLPPARDVAPAAAVVAASVIDAYVVALRNNREYEREREPTRATDSPDAAAGPDATPAEPPSGEERSASAETIRCPECGRETDPTFDFCQWCAEPTEGRDAS